MNRICWCFIAALALVWSACSGEEVAPEPEAGVTEVSLEGDVGVTRDAVQGAPDTTLADVALQDSESVEAQAFDFSVPAEPTGARAGRLVDEAGLLLGPKREGQLGDVRIDNAHVAFILAGVRRSSGYSYWGGNVIDAARWRSDGSLSPDYFGELFFAWNLDVFRPTTMEIVDDGRASGRAHVRFTGKSDLFHFAEAALGSFLNLEAPELDLVYDYTLGSDDKALTLTVTLTNTKQSALWIDWPLLMSNAGDGVFNYVPEHGYADLNGSAVPYMGLAGRRVGYAFVSERDDIKTIYGYAGVTIFQVEGFEIPKASSLTRRFFVAATDAGPSGLDEALRALRGTSADAHLVEGSVSLDGGALAPEPWVVVRRASDDAVMGISPVDSDGAFRLSLEAGEYRFSAHAEGHAASEARDVQVQAEPQALEPLLIPKPARVTLKVSELASGEPTPGRVTFIKSDDTPSAYAPSDARPAQKTWDDARSAVAYVTGPDTMVTLPAGSYSVTASRGPTHEIEQREVTLSAGEELTLEMSVEQVIDTTGWLSGDFHIHAYWSPDSYVPWEIRARQAATEDLDLPILTEHVYAAGLQGTIDELGISEHAIGVVGQEVTTFTHGHFNAFPLELRPEDPSSGAVYPHGKEPGELFAAIRDQHPGDEIIQVNHPRGSGISSYFSYVGLDADQDSVVRPFEWSTNWDAIEVFNGGCGKGQEFDDWVGLTNHGHRKALAAGSDSHGEDGLIGTPRNWIQVDVSSVRADSQALVSPIRERRSFISCGPFVRFERVNAEGEKLAGLGELAGLDTEGDAHFHVKVEAPTWMTLDEVRLLENGQVIRVEDITTSEDPIVRFDAVWSVTPMADAWYAVEVVGSGSMAPVTWSGPPYALTNPIEIDHDGDGAWKPPGATNLPSPKRLPPRDHAH